MDVVFVLGKKEKNCFDSCTRVNEKQATMRLFQAAPISVAGNTTRYYVHSNEAMIIMATEHHKLVQALSPLNFDCKKRLTSAASICA